MPSFYVWILLILVLYYTVEYFFLKHQVRQVPLRILINGTRGKSTTVRILHSILLFSGIRAFARTTGDEVREYYADGSSRVRKRIAPANILEIIRLIFRWRRQKPEAIVLECMVIQPALQKILARILRPTHIVFTNFLEDHFESMGTDMGQIRTGMLHGIYKDSIIFLPQNERQCADPLLKTMKVEYFNPEDFQEKIIHVPPYLIAQNWGLICSVCKCLKIPTETVRPVFLDIWESIGRSLVLSDKFSKNRLINLFSVNDIRSAKLFISFFSKEEKPEYETLILLNTRFDRPLRTLAFLSMIRDEFPDLKICFTGDGRFFAGYHAVRLKLNPSYRTAARTDLRNTLTRFADRPLNIFGMANHKGMEYFLSEFKMLDSI